MFASGLAHTGLRFKSPTKRRGRELFLSTVLAKLGSYKSEMVQGTLAGHSRGKHSCCTQRDNKVAIGGNHPAAMWSVLWGKSTVK